jgi:D-alanyl-D-alanine carboxypeptidase (penicillin-binding protein 5/6)
MNGRARELGAADTNFVNCTGLPAPGGYSCARDIAVMTRALLSHPDYYRYSTVWMEDMLHPGGRVTGLTNTNKLVRFYEGCDGGKTGFTNEAKFCLSATAKRNDLRLISVVIGADDGKVRFAEVSRLLNYGFANYENKVLLLKDQILETPAPVKNGKTKEIRLRAAEEIGVFGARGKAAEGAEVVREIRDITAPVKAGEIVGKIKVVRNGSVIAETNIAAAEDVQKRGYKDILKDMVDKM